MTEMTHQSAQSPAQSLTPSFRGILYLQLLSQRRVLTGFWMTWLILGLVLPLFHHPAWILALGSLYALFAGTVFGGMDALDGAQEFTHALPPSRSELYLLRLVLPGVHLVLLLVAGLSTIALGLPQLLWGLVVESGFTEPFPHASGSWYAFALAIPVNLFACTHLMVTATTTASLTRICWFLGLVLCLIALGAGVLLDMAVWGHPTGMLACPFLFVVALALLAFGHHAAVRKEAVNLPRQAAPHSSLFSVLFIVGIVLLLLLLLVTMGMTHAPSSVSVAVPMVPQRTPVTTP
jgi:hypothetical protein